MPSDAEQEETRQRWERRKANTVYLCGGINGLSDSQCKDWRQEARELLASGGIGVLDPMRRDYRGKEAESVQEIVKGDLEDIGRSGIVLVNASRPSWGTAMEIVYAHQQKKRIVAFGAGDRPSPWLLYHCEKLVASVAEAVAYILETR